MSIPTKRLDALEPTANPGRDHKVAAMRDGISNNLRIEQILSLLQADDIPDDAITLAKLGADARAAIDEALLRGKIIGEPFFLFDNITGVSAPDNSGEAKYIRLTAGQSGAGGYNEGLLTNESVSGSAPLVEATAEIATGPLAGQIVPLINTEEAFLRARETSGALQMDQKQRTTGRFANGRSSYSNTSYSLGTEDGAFTGIGGHTNGPSASSGPGWTNMDFDSANSPDARVSATTAGETRSKNRSATAYMRIA